MMRKFLTSGSFAILLLSAAPASTQNVQITVGTFTSEKSCTTYELEWGKELAYADRKSAVVARAWGTELVRDCQRNFPGLRGTIASAVASAGAANGPRGRLTLTGRLTDVGYENKSVTVSGSTVAGQSMVVSVDFQVKNAAGGIVYGGSLTKHFPIDASVETANISYTQTQSGRTNFSQLQREVAYAVARAVIFHLAPVRVVANDGHRIQLNYGSPLIPLGAAILVPHGSTLKTSRLNVTSATVSQAIAESEGGARLADVPVGAIVTFAEADDPGANQTVFERVELPEH